jgi:hypothetical protein
MQFVGHQNNAVVVGHEPRGSLRNVFWIPALTPYL